MPTGASSDDVVPPAQVDGRVADHRHALVRDAVVGEVGHLRRHHDQPGARQLARERDHAALVHPLVVDAVRDDQTAPARLAARAVDARAKAPARAVDGQVLLDQRVATGLGRRTGGRARTTAPSASCRRASSGGRATIPAPPPRPTPSPSLPELACALAPKFVTPSATRSATGQQKTKSYDSATVPRFSSSGKVAVGVYPGLSAAKAAFWARAGQLVTIIAGASGGGLAPGALAE